MQPDDLKAAWQAESAKARITIDMDILLTEFRRNQKQFDTMIFLRDAREVGVALIMIPPWIYWGFRSELPVTWYLTIPALLWVAGYMLWDRHVQKKKRPPADAPLRENVQGALADVTHQISLLRNVHWWYLIPLGVPIFAFFTQTAWNLRETGWEALIFWLFLVAFLVGLYWFLYWVNQYAVRKQLEPRRAELEMLLSNLENDVLNVN